MQTKDAHSVDAAARRTAPTTKVAIVHDYLTQRGGAERVVLAMLKAFPDAVLYASLFDPDETFPAFRQSQVRTLRLDRVPLIRRDHRLALPFLAPSFTRLEVAADVVLCSSSGWAHGTRVEGRKVVYCHTPARWLYQRDSYLRESGLTATIALHALHSYLLRWDRRAAASAHRYLANSTAVRSRICEVYGREAEVLAPPQSIDAGGPRTSVDGIEPGFLLCVSRLLPYKNVDAIIRAFTDLRHHRLVVVGTGPDESRLRALARPNVSFLPRVSDEQLRWLYASCSGLLAASYEDFGLTPVEAASFGKPAAVLRWGGFLDTVEEARTGLFFDRPEAGAIANAVRQLGQRAWNSAALQEHAERYAEPGFVARLREIVAEEAALGGGSSAD